MTRTFSNSIRLPDFRSTFPIVLSLVVSIGALAEDWPQWGGLDPGRNRYSTAKGLAETFDPGEFSYYCQMDGPSARSAGEGTPVPEVRMEATQNLKWIAFLGDNSIEAPTIANGKVFIGSETRTENSGSSRQAPGKRSCRRQAFRLRSTAVPSRRMAFCT